MTFDEFHNGLRILLNIDKRCFDAAVGEAESYRWEVFVRDPWRWFIAAPTPVAKKVWEIVESRATHTVRLSGNTFAQMPGFEPPRPGDEIPAGVTPGRIDLMNLVDEVLTAPLTPAETPSEWDQAIKAACNVIRLQKQVPFGDGLTPVDGLQRALNAVSSLKSVKRA